MHYQEIAVLKAQISNGLRTVGFGFVKRILNWNQAFLTQKALSAWARGASASIAKLEIMERANQKVSIQGFKPLSFVMFQSEVFEDLIHLRRFKRRLRRTAL